MARFPFTVDEVRRGRVYAHSPDHALYFRMSDVPKRYRHAVAVGAMVALGPRGGIRVNLARWTKAEVAAVHARAGRYL